LALLYHAWRTAGCCPFRTFNLLDEGYRRVSDGVLVRPPHPRRVQSVLYIFAQQSASDQVAALTSGVGGL
jgi:hypothetical protein